LDQISAFKAANLFDFKSLALKGRKKQIGRFKTATRTELRYVPISLAKLFCWQPNRPSLQQGADGSTLNNSELGDIATVPDSSASSRRTIITRPDFLSITGHLGRLRVPLQFRQAPRPSALEIRATP
jgi:hypothetical protein